MVDTEPCRWNSVDATPTCDWDPECPAHGNPVTAAVAEALAEYDGRDKAESYDRKRASVAVRALRDHDRAAGQVTVDAADLGAVLEFLSEKGFGWVLGCPADRLRAALGGER